VIRFYVVASGFFKLFTIRSAQRNRETVDLVESFVHSGSATHIDDYVRGANRDLDLMVSGDYERIRPGGRLPLERGGAAIEAGSASARYQ